MAYSTTGHWPKVNYYSNPDVIFPRTGTPTGFGGVSNNARVLKEMIGQMAALGDESGTCNCNCNCKCKCKKKCRDKKGRKKKKCLKKCKKKC